MTELHHLKMKFGEAEFEANVPENKVQPMYAQFLFMIERQSQMPIRPFEPGVTGPAEEPDIDAPAFTGTAGPSGETVDPELMLLTRIFYLGEDGAISLKLLPTGPDKNADAMLLILYGYHRLKHEDCVLATQLFRAAEQSGISLRRPANEYVRNGRFVNRGGQRKGSHYSLNSQGLAMAKEIIVKMIA